MVDPRDDTFWDFKDIVPDDKDWAGNGRDDVTTTMTQVKASKVNVNGQLPRGSSGFTVINILCTGFFLILSIFNVLVAAVGQVDYDVCEQTADIEITGKSQNFYKVFSMWGGE